MWPKVIAQLFELLPHISRLLPMADRFLSSKAAAEKANEVALAAMADGVRGDLGQITKAHSGLYRQLQDQSAQLTEVSEEVKRARLSLDQHDHRLESMEKNLSSIGRWIKGGISILAILLAAVIALLLRAR
jgi:chromosome segregation ATPase